MKKRNSQLLTPELWCTLRHRNLLVRQMVQIKNKIGMLLMDAGIVLTDVGDKFVHYVMTDVAPQLDAGVAAKPKEN
ncbi:MAG TPA: hypothetical protein VMP68_23535 [Candidatus Eisenbacteria bacterium]|nr:hypothetical protein [Candidatus Eisenbacteria bacterium]